MSFFPRIRYFVLGAVGVLGAGLLTATALAPAASAATPVSGALLKQWTVSSQYYLGGNMTITPDGDTAYFMNPYGSIGHLNLATRAVSNIAINIPGSVGSMTDVYTNYPETVAVSPDATTAYVQVAATVAGQSHAGLLKISLVTGAILNSLDLGLSQQSATSPVLSSDGTTVYAATQFAGPKSNNSSLFAINAASFKITASKTFAGSDNPDQYSDT